MQLNEYDGMDDEYTDEYGDKYNDEYTDEHDDWRTDEIDAEYDDEYNDKYWLHSIKLLWTWEVEVSPLPNLAKIPNIHIKHQK